MNLNPQKKRGSNWKMYFQVLMNSKSNFSIWELEDVWLFSWKVPEKVLLIITMILCNHNFTQECIKFNPRILLF